MSRYILVEWPESQKWMDHPDCYLAADNDELREFFTPLILSQRIFIIYLNND